MRHNFFVVLSCLFCAGASGVEATASAADKPAEVAPEKTPVRPAEEKAPVDFPLTLQGFFGKGDDASASLRELKTGKSLWLARGDKFGKWKVESVDVAKGSVVLSSAGRNCRLAIAGEGATVDEPLPARVEDCVIYSRLRHAIQADEKLGERIQGWQDESERRLKTTHPEYFTKEGRFDLSVPGAEIARLREVRSQVEAEEAPVVMPYKEDILLTVRTMETVYPRFEKDVIAARAGTAPASAPGRSPEDLRERVVFGTVDRLAGVKTSARAGADESP